MQNKSTCTPVAAETAATAVIPQPEATPAEPPVTNPPSPFVGFADLARRYPFYGERTLRDLVKRKILPACRPPGSRKLVFHLESCDRALLRYQRGGIE
jgi:hypothetical protein